MTDPNVTDPISANAISERLPVSVAARLRVPLLVAPMLRISGPDLVVAACRAGAIGAFPAVNARTTDVLDSWLDQISQAVSGTDAAPHCVNIVMSRPDWRDHVTCLVSHGVEMVVTSVGSPGPAVPPLHRAGCLVFADVATLAHARKAVAAGADGLVLLTAGAGGQTGWLNPFAFVRAVRDFYDGPVLLSGGMSDGVALRAAVTLGADLGYMGTRFIAAAEGMASDAYRSMLIGSDIDDVLLTRAFTGLPANFLRPAIAAAGLDPGNLDEEVTPEIADAVYGGRNPAPGPKRWSQVFSAGHTVSAIAAVQPAAAIIAEVTREFHGLPRATAANEAAR